MSNFTEGPWWIKSVESSLDDCFIYNIYCSNGYIGSVDSSREENIFNAYLLSSAPDLYAALVLLSSVSKDVYANDEQTKYLLSNAIKIADYVINKSEPPK